MSSSMQAWTGQATSFISPPCKLGAGSFEPRPTFFADKFDTFGMSGPAMAARDHCRWAHDSGESPQSVMKSVGRPSHPLSTWGDAIRAVEAVSYANKLAATRKAYKDEIACL